MQTGLVRMGEAEYRHLDAINASLLKHGAVTMADLRAQQLAPDKDSQPKAIGREVHGQILEPDLHGEGRSCVVRRHDGRSKEGKAELAAIREGGLAAFSVDEWAAIQAQVAALKGSERVADALARGECETACLWTDAETGEPCKAKLDLIVPEYFSDGSDLIADIKTTQSVEERSFRRSCENMPYGFGYYLQAAFYLRGYHAATGRFARFHFYAVLKTAPYHVRRFECGRDALRAANANISALLRAYHKCTKHNIWPGYSQALVII